MQERIARKWTILITAGLVGLVGLQLLIASSATAGTYTSSQCLGGVEPAPDAKKGGNAPSEFNIENRCGASSSQGLFVNLPEAASWGEWGEWGFDAPNGTVFQRVQTWAHLSSTTPSVCQPQLYYHNVWGDWVFGSGNAPFWAFYDTGGNIWASHFGGALVGASPTQECSNLASGTVISDVFLTVDDVTAPNVTSLSGPLVEQSWVRQSANVTINGSDVGSGVAGLGINVNGTGTSTVDTCNEEYLGGSNWTRRLKPCADGASRTLTENTTAGPYHNGDNTVQLRVNDFATTSPNFGSVTRTVRVDNVAPGAPENLNVAGGSGWRATNDFDVSWTNPPHDGFSPANGAAYEIVNQQGEVVEGPTHVSGGAISEITDIDVPGPGEFTLRVRLRDDAGNEGAAATATVRFDPTAPGASTPHQANGWISRGEFPHLQRWEFPANNIPPSGIQGYAIVIDRNSNTDPCDVDGNDSMCVSAEITHPGPGNVTETIADLTEGSNYVHVAAVSGSGVPSSIRHTELKVDKTDPTVELEGVPIGTANDPVTLIAQAHDSLSGMQPLPESDDGQPETVIEVDGQRYAGSGDSAAVTLKRDAVYNVRYWARDLAGNEPSPTEVQTAKVKINSSLADLDIAFNVKRRVKAGKRARFWGHVKAANAELPSNGKLIEVQVRTGKKWRTVGKAFRTDAKGDYVLRYRFRRFYTRPVKFKFRLKVHPEPGWPYSKPSYSTRRKVKVVPRRN